MYRPNHSILWDELHFYWRFHHAISYTHIQIGNNWTHWHLNEMGWYLRTKFLNAFLMSGPNCFESQIEVPLTRCIEANTHCLQRASVFIMCAHGSLPRGKLIIINIQDFVLSIVSRPRFYWDAYQDMFTLCCDAFPSPMWICLSTNLLLVLVY